jgi:hypothetical protein
MGEEAGLLQLLVSNLLTGVKGADLVIRDNVVIQYVISTLYLRLLQIRSAPTLYQACRLTVLRGRLRILYVTERYEICSVTMI